MQNPDNLSALYRCAIQENQRQKIRELDFCKSSSQASTQCDINAIKGSGCYKCGSNDHFIKDFPLNRDNDKKDSSLTHGQQKHYNDHRSKSNDENSIEKSIQAVRDLFEKSIETKTSHHILYLTNPHIDTHMQTHIQITSHHTNTHTTDLTNQTIGDTTIRANIGTIPE